MKANCPTCEQMHVETIAEAPDGPALRLDGPTINDRVRSLHEQLEELLTGMNETRIYKLTDIFVK